MADGRFEETKTMTITKTGWDGSEGQELLYANNEVIKKQEEIDGK